MKKLLLLILICVCACTSYSQSVQQRSAPAITVQDARWMGQYNLFAPRFADTTAANIQKGVDSCGALIFTYDWNGYWYRACNPKHWVQIFPGGTPSTDTLAWKTSGNSWGSGSPYLGTITANGIRIGTSNVTRLILPSGGIVRSTSPTVKPMGYDTVSKIWYYTDDAGGSAVDSITTEKGNCRDIQSYWVDGVRARYDTIYSVPDRVTMIPTITQTDSLTFDVSEAGYNINCVNYTAGGVTLTLDTLVNPVNSRIDIVAGNTSGNIVIVKGSESTAPAPPNLTSDEIALTFILVAGDSISEIPPVPSIVNLYTSDGTLTGNRTVYSGGFNLSFQPFTTFTNDVWISKYSDTKGVGLNFGKFYGLTTLRSTETGSPGGGDFAIDMDFGGIKTTALYINREFNYIGVGTDNTNPSASLDIAGTLKYDHTSAAADLWLKSTDADGNAIWDTLPTSTSSVPLANSAFVSKSGNDGTGAVGNAALPFLTIQAAITAATSGQTVFVSPGTYAEALIGKDGVNLDFAEGAILADNTATGMAAIYDNNVKAVFEITGRGVLSQVGVPSSGGVFLLENNLSRVTVRAKKIDNGDPNNPAIGLSKGAQIKLYVDSIVGDESGIEMADSAQAYVYGGVIMSDFAPVYANNTSKIYGYNAKFYCVTSDAAVSLRDNSYGEFWDSYLYSTGFNGADIVSGNVRFYNCKIESAHTSGTDRFALLFGSGSGETAEFTNCQLISHSTSPYAIKPGTPVGKIKFLTSCWTNKPISSNIEDVISYGLHNLQLNNDSIDGGHSTLDTGLVIHADQLAYGSLTDGYVPFYDNATGKPTWGYVPRDSTTQYVTPTQLNDSLNKLTVDSIRIGNTWLYTRQVTVTDTEILDIHNNPVTLIPAPGAGKAIEIISASMYLDYNTTPYVPNGNDYLSIGHSSITRAWQSYGTSMSVSQDQGSVFRNVSGDPFINNESIELFDNDGFTGGDSDVKIYLYYRILTL